MARGSLAEGEASLRNSGQLPIEVCDFRSGGTTKLLLSVERDLRLFLCPSFLGRNGRHREKKQAWGFKASWWSFWDQDSIWFLLQHCLLDHRARPLLCSSRMGTHRFFPRVGKAPSTRQTLAFLSSMVSVLVWRCVFSAEGPAFCRSERLWMRCKVGKRNTETSFVREE